MSDQDQNLTDAQKEAVTALELQYGDILIYNVSGYVLGFRRPTKDEVVPFLPHVMAFKNPNSSKTNIVDPAIAFCTATSVYRADPKLTIKEIANQYCIAFINIALAIMDKADGNAFEIKK